MAQTPSTWADYVGDGVEDTFQVTFPYQKQQEVFVTVDGAPAAFTFISVGWIQLAAAPANGAVIRVQRSTEAFEPRHEFANGVPLLPRFIDENNKQFLYAVQESVNDTAGTAALALYTAELALDTAQDALTLVGERTQYMVLGAYGPGLHFQTPNQVFSYDAGSGAEYYAPGPSITLPYTTTGVGAAEIANFRSVGDAILRSDLAADGGSALVGFIQDGAGAVPRTAQDKMRETVSVWDYTSLSNAIAYFAGGSGVVAVVGTVAIANDTTIPENISLQVGRDGVFNVTAGKRLYINGPFSAPKFHRCFQSSLLTTAITASVDGGALIVTAAEQNVLTEGHVIVGDGILDGQMIQNAYGNTGIGTYSLRDFNGVIASQSMTAIGASVIFGAGAVDCVYPEWWGALRDGGITDNGVAIKQAIYSIRWGGRIKFSAGPLGSYMVSAANAEIVLHAGLTIDGDAAADNGTGAPPNGYTKMSQIWLNGDNASLFLAGGTTSHIRVNRIVLSSGPTIGGANLAPIGINKKGIVYNGHAGQSVYGPVFEDCFFANFSKGVYLNDSWAGPSGGVAPAGDGVAPAGYFWSGQTINATDMPTTGMGTGIVYEVKTVGTTNWGALDAVTVSGVLGTVGWRFRLNSNTPAVTGSGTVYTMPTYYDWAIDPIIFRNCQFMGNARGVEINTTNADAVRFEDCVFLLPANSAGLYLYRSGFVKLDTCFAFGGSNAGSEFVHLFGNGPSSLDQVVMDNCQSEFCAHHLIYAGGTNDGSPQITLRNNIHQLGSDIYLAKPCEFTSYNSQVMSFIYYDSPGIRIHSYNDTFFFQNFTSGPTWGPSAVSGDANTIYTYIPGKSPCSSLTQGPILEGLPVRGIFGAGSPVGAVTPAFRGLDYFDITGIHWWKSTGTTNMSWVQLG